MTTDEEILEELRKIREALSPKPTPPPPKPKGLWAEFIEFIGKAGVIGLAVGFIMGTYIGKVVSALVQDIIMPIPGRCCREAIGERRYSPSQSDKG